MVRMNHIHNYTSFLNEASREVRIFDLEEELENLEADIKQAYSDMENDPDIEIEGGPVADEWGGKIDKMEKEVEKIKEKIAKLKIPIKPREPKPFTDAKKLLTKNIDDIKQSMKSYPDRTVQQQAEIYKKRYKIKDGLETIATALKEIIK